MTTTAVDLCRAARERGIVAGLDQAPGLGLALATGPDVKAFLQARLTSDVSALDPGQGQLSAKLTGRGTLVGYFSLHRLPDLGRPFPAFFLLASRTDLAAVLADLAATVITEDVLLEDVTSEFNGCLFQGPGADECLDLLGCGREDGVSEHSLAGPRNRGANLPVDLMILTRSFTGDPGRVLLWSAGGPEDFAARCGKVAEEVGMVRLGTETEHDLAWRWLTAEAGWPCTGRDFESGRRLLPGTGLEHQVASATKGCYPGQEVVARIKTYGSVPTALRGLMMPEIALDDLEKVPQPGEPILSAGKKIGTWGSGAWAATRDSVMALAFLGRDHRTPGTELPVAVTGRETAAEVVLPQVHRASDQQELSRNLYDRAIRSFSSGEDAEAVRLLEQVIGLDPGLHDAYEALGVILGRGERYLEAIDVFRRLEEVAPGEPMVHTNLSLFYMKIGDRDEAEHQKAQATLKRFASAADPGEAEAMREAAAVAAREDASRRLAMFTEVLDLDPDDSLALMGMGKALTELEDHTGAEGYLERALAAQPDNSALYAARGKNLESLGRSEQARDVYRQGISVASRRGDLMPLKDMEHRLLLLEA